MIQRFMTKSSPAFLIMVLLTVLPCHAAHRFVFSFGSLGTGNGQFRNPSAIAVNSSGNIYVADMENSRLQVFDAKGIFLRVITHQKMERPWGLAIDPRDNVYVASLDSVLKFSPKDVLIMEIGHDPDLPEDKELEWALDVSLDASGNVLVTDIVRNLIRKYSPKGEWLSQFGGKGTGNGQFHQPNGVATESKGNIYVSDQENHRIQKFDPNGKFLLSWGTKGSARGQFDNPQQVRVAGERVYVADGENHRVQIFDLNGKFLEAFGTHGTGDGQFDFPLRLSIDASGNVFVCDDSGRVQKFAP